MSGPVLSVQHQLHILSIPAGLLGVFSPARGTTRGSSRKLLILSSPSDTLCCCLQPRWYSKQVQRG